MRLANKIFLGFVILSVIMIAFNWLVYTYFPVEMEKSRTSWGVITELFEGDTSSISGFSESIVNVKLEEFMLSLVSFAFTTRVWVPSPHKDVLMLYGESNGTSGVPSRE